MCFGWPQFHFILLFLKIGDPVRYRKINWVLNASADNPVRVSVKIYYKTKIPYENSEII